MRNKALGLAAICLCLSTSSFAIPNASAQWNERHWKRYNKNQVEKTIKNLEASSDDFRKDFDRWLDDSPLDGRTKEDRFNKRVKDFENSLDRLRKEFDKRDSWWETRNEVRAMLSEAKPVANMMDNRLFRGSSVLNEWRRLRGNVNRLASTYRLPRV